MLRTIAFLAGLIGVLLFVAAAVVGGALMPGYSHVAQFISESYAIGTLHGPLLRFAAYLPSGMLIAVFAWAAARILQVNWIGGLGFFGLGVFYGLGTVVTAFFPCDAGCNKEFIDPSISQLIHTLSGFLTYLIVPVSLLLIGAALLTRPPLSRLGALALACGAMAMVGFMALLGIGDAPYAGLVQRVIEGAILFWTAACAFTLRILPRAEG